MIGVSRWWNYGGLDGMMGSHLPMFYHAPNGGMLRDLVGMKKNGKEWEKIGKDYIQIVIQSVTQL